MSIRVVTFLFAALAGAASMPAQTVHACSDGAVAQPDRDRAAIPTATRAKTAGHDGALRDGSTSSTRRGQRAPRQRATLHVDATTLRVQAPPGATYGLLLISTRAATVPFAGLQVIVPIAMVPIPFDGSGTFVHRRDGSTAPGTLYVQAVVGGSGVARPIASNVAALGDGSEPGDGSR